MHLGFSLLVLDFMFLCDLYMTRAKKQRITAALDWPMCGVWPAALESEKL